MDQTCAIEKLTTIDEVRAVLKEEVNRRFKPFALPKPYRSTMVQSVTYPLKEFLGVHLSTFPNKSKLKIRLTSWEGCYSISHG